MKTIYKYEIDSKVGAVRMPVGAQVLKVGLKDDRAVLWALVDTDEPTRDRYFAVYGTGTEIHCEILGYWGSFMTYSEALRMTLVMHVLEIVPYSGGRE